MAKRKLTPKLRAYLETKYYRERIRDYKGEALAYLREQKAAAQARSALRAKTLKIGDTVIPENSEMYRIVALSAIAKNQTIRKYARENEAAITQLATDGYIYLSREIDYLIDDIKLAQSINISSRSGGKDVKTGKSKSKYYFIHLKQTMLNIADVYDSILVEHSYDLKGNMYVNFPLPDEYEEMEDEEDLLEYIDRFYPNIHYYRNDKETAQGSITTAEG